MAFDRPIEADRVDELGILTSIVRGPIMWILGGNPKKKRGDKRAIAEENTNCDSDTSENDKSSSKTSANRIAPDLSTSDVSDSGDGIDSCSSDDEDDDSKGHNGTNNNDGSKSSHDEMSLAEIRRSFRKSRKMSWSDESGQNLVEYCGEASSTQASQITSSSIQSASRRPIKPAIRVSKMGTGKRRPLHASQCLPSGLAGGTISMPTGGGMMKTGPPGSVPVTGSNGYISPQWGWYISTTPPTPEPYYSSSHTKKEPDTNQPQLLAPMTGNNTNNFITTGPNQHSIRQKPGNVPVFTRGTTNGVTNAASGWPSVPL